jgi:hypothetical protein
MRGYPRTSVADPGCLSRILIFNPSRIPDLKTATKEMGEKNLLSYLFCSHKCHKLENYFIFGMRKKKLAQFSKYYRTFYPKICH